MKKLLIIGILCLFATNSFGIEYNSVGDNYNIGKISGINYITPSGGFPLGMTFLGLYDEGINADSARGSVAATFACDRINAGTVSPGTYFDSSGVMQIMAATDNTPRFNHGYYNTTGWHPFSHAGVMIEGASTNRAAQSEVFENVAWTKANCTANDDEVASIEGDTHGASLTATAGNATLTQAYVDAAAGVYTASCWIKRKTGTGVINLRANTADGYTAITTSVTAVWTRVQISSASLVNPTFDLQIVDNADAIYIWGAQLEKLPFATSYIPQTNADLTRNAETLKYEIAGNRTAAVESFIIKLAPTFKDTVAGNKYIFDTDTKNRNMLFGTGNDVAIFSNQTDSGASTVSDLINDSWTANTEMTLGYTMESGVVPYIAGFFNGVADGTNQVAADFVAPAWGANTNIGSGFGGNIFYGTIFSMGFWDKVLTATEMDDLHDWDWTTLPIPRL